MNVPQATRSPRGPPPDLGIGTRGGSVGPAVLALVVGDRGGSVERECRPGFQRE